MDLLFTADSSPPVHGHLGMDSTAEPEAKPMTPSLPKPKRLYSLFTIGIKPNGRKHYTRLTVNAPGIGEVWAPSYPKEEALRRFQDRLIAGSMGLASLVEL